MRIGVLHGPNLNLLGRREPEVYGRATLEQVNARLEAVAAELGVALEVFQSNGEGQLVDWIQESAARVEGYIVNAGGYTHTSVAILDALLGVGRPYVEVHVTNPQAREPFRHRSLLAPRAAGTVAGFGIESYVLGLRGLVALLRSGR